MCKKFVIDFGVIPPDLFKDQITFSEYIVSKYLPKIPDSVSLTDEKRSESEIALQGFLMYAIREYDQLLQMINKGLKL